MKNTTIVFFLLVTSLIWIQTAQGQTSVTELLSRRLEPLETEADSVHLMLAKISNDYGIPIGFEAATEGESPLLSVVIQNRSLKEVLDEIVRKDPRYEWVIADGVINVRPRSERDPILMRLVETRIKDLDVKKGASLFRARSQIVETPEVQEILRQANMSLPYDIKFGGEFAKLGRDFSHHFSNATVREILNQVIRTSDVKYWIVNRGGKDKEFLILNF